MSALLAPMENVERPRAPRSGRVAPRSGRAALRSVATTPMRASRMVFVIVMLAVLALGMVGVLLLNTTIQERAVTVTAAQRTAEDLGYKNAQLTAQVEQLRSSSDLATRAWQMGMRPNPYPVFVQLDGTGGGRVVGDPMRVSGTELPNQQYRGADQVTEQIQKSRAAALAQKEKARQELKARLAAQRAQAEARARAEAAAREARVKAEAAARAAQARAEAAARAAQARPGAAAPGTPAAPASAKSTGGH